MNGDRHVIDEELKTLLSDPVRLFLKNREAMKKGFPWQGALTHCLCALLRTNRAAQLDAARVKDMRSLVRSRTGGFSQFRGLPMLPLATLLSGSLMPEDDLDRVLRLYDALHAAGFSKSPYLVETAFMPLLNRDGFDGDSCAAAAHDMVALQRRAHPFLDAQPACMLAFLAAVSGKTPEAEQDEAERAYVYLKKVFPSAGTTYSLARVLTLGEGDMDEKCARTLALYQELRAQGLRYGKYYELPALGVLALLPGEPDVLAGGIKAVDARLKAEKGFSAWTVQTSERILYAASLHALALLEGNEDVRLSEGLLQSVTGVLIAAQTAAYIGAAAAASASASSGGN